MQECPEQSAFLNAAALVAMPTQPDCNHGPKFVPQDKMMRTNLAQSDGSLPSPDQI